MSRLQIELLTWFFANAVAYESLHCAEQTPHLDTPPARIVFYGVPDDRLLTLSLTLVVL